MEKSKGQVRLSLGSGKRPEKGYEALDIVDYGHNIVWDAEKIEPLPYKDNSIEFIKAYNFLEHISWEAARNVLNECHRVLVNNKCELEIVVPKAGTVEDFSDPTHKSHWTKETFEKYICGHRPRNADYGLSQWKMQQIVDHPSKSNCLLVNIRPVK